MRLFHQLLEHIDHPRCSFFEVIIDGSRQGREKDSSLLIHRDDAKERILFDCSGYRSKHLLVTNKQLRLGRYLHIVPIDFTGNDIQIRLTGKIFFAALLIVKIKRKQGGEGEENFVASRDESVYRRRKKTTKRRNESLGVQLAHTGDALMRMSIYIGRDTYGRYRSSCFASLSRYDYVVEQSPMKTY